MTNRLAEPDAIILLALVKGPSRYTFTIPNNDRDRAAALRTFGRFASNPDLNFTWYDAALLSQRLRNQPA